MKTLLNDYIVPIITVGGVVADFLFRIYSPTSLSFLIRPIFSINILEIILIVAIFYSICRFVPVIRSGIIKRNRANNLLVNWGKFKQLLVQSNTMEQNQSLQKEYSILRAEIEKDFNYFLDEIIKIQKASHRNYNEIVLRNLEKCWSPRNINEWKGEVLRLIPKALDCFDYVFVGLVEEMKK